MVYPSKTHFSLFLPTKYDISHYQITLTKLSQNIHQYNQLDNLSKGNAGSRTQRSGSHYTLSC